MGDVKGVSNEVARTLVATGRTDPLSCVHHLGGLSEATSHGGARDLCRKKIAASTSLAAAAVDQTSPGASALTGRLTRRASEPPHARPRKPREP
jgi:hypothetical protein